MGFDFCMLSWKATNNLTTLSGCLNKKFHVNFNAISLEFKLIQLEISKKKKNIWIFSQLKQIACREQYKYIQIDWKLK